MGKVIAVVIRCSHFDIPVKKETVQSLGLSQLKSCSVVWSAANKSHLSRLQVAQSKAARLLFRCPFLTSVIDMHHIL